MRYLDLEAVQAFVFVADLKSFTRAAEAMGSTQSAVSLKLKRLEDGLGRRLIERTPRRVRISADGEMFLDAARGLIGAQERALATFAAERRRLAIGISHHIVGAELPALLRRMGEHDPSLIVEIRVAGSEDVLKEFDAGGLDAALVLRHDDTRRDGEVLLQERFGWFAASDWTRAARRAAAHRHPVRDMRAARELGSCARRRGHPLDRGVCRRRHRNDRCGRIGGPCGRSARAALRAAGRDRRRRTALAAGIGAVGRGAALARERGAIARRLAEFCGRVPRNRREVRRSSAITGELRFDRVDADDQTLVDVALVALDHSIAD